MVKRKRDLPPIPNADPPRAELSSGSSPDAYSVAAYQEGRSWIAASAAILSSAPSPGTRVSSTTRSPGPGKLPLVVHRPSIEAYWHARFGPSPFSRAQHDEIVRETEFSYDELLCPSMLFAPLYGDLASVTRQRMIVRNWLKLKESLGTLVREGRGPTSH
jgi:hypothetical protein